MGKPLRILQKVLSVKSNGLTKATVFSRPTRNLNRHDTMDSTPAILKPLDDAALVQSSDQLLPNDPQLPTDRETIATEFIKGLKHSYKPTLPDHLFESSSTFSDELKALVLHHLRKAPTEEAVHLKNRQVELWSNPDTLFFDCRASFHRYTMRAYDRSIKTLRQLDEDDSGDPNGFRIIPVFRLLSSYRKSLGENPIYIQARSNNWIIGYDHRDENNRHERVNLDIWLGSDVIQLAENPMTKGTWLPYVRTLIGLSDDPPAQTTGHATPIQLPLSSLILLFLKCSNTKTETFPFVGEDGHWRLPTIEGNQGGDEHLFYNATDEVTVTVV